MKTRRACLTATVLLFAACFGESAGDAGAEEAAAWSLEVVHQIGSIEDESQSLTRIGDVVIGSDRGLFVGQASDGNVRSYGADGELRTIIGRRGEGPEEIGGVGRLGILDGQLWVHDTGNRKVLRFGADGEFLQASGWAPGSIGEGPSIIEPGFPRDLHLFEDGSSLVSPGMVIVMRIGEPPPTDLPAPPILRVAADGAAFDTVALLDQPRRDAPPEDWIPAVQAGPLHALDGRGDGVILIERASAGNPEPGIFRVARVDLAGDTVFNRDYRYTPIAVPPGTAERRFERLSDRMQDQYRNKVWVSETLPPVSELVVTQDGTIWLAREAEAQDSVAWWALDPDTGDHIGTIHLPPGHEIVAGQGEVLVAKRTDEFDVPYLVRYEVGL